MNYKKLLALVLAILMALTLTACGGGGGGGDKPSEPTFKKTFTYSVGGEPTYMDPARCGDSVTAEIHNEIWYPLFYLTEKGSPAKGDCIDYTIDDSGTVYTFKLDPNAKWSDGVALTADQYVYGIKRCIGMGYEDVGYLTMITNYILNAEKHVHYYRHRYSLQYVLNLLLKRIQSGQILLVIRQLVHSFQQRSTQQVNTSWKRTHTSH